MYDFTYQKPSSLTEVVKALSGDGDAGGRSPVA